MKNILEFAEWIGTNCFENGKGLNYERSGFNKDIGKWKLYYESDYVNSLEVYSKWCKYKGYNITIDDKISYYENDFIFTKFIEYIGDNKYYYFRWKYNNIEQTPYWIIGDSRCSTEELYEKFKNI